MDVIENAIICLTPYHVMSALNLFYSDYKKTDVYILNHFSNSERIADNLRREALFNAVKWVDDQPIINKYFDNNNKSLMRIKKAFNYFRADEIASIILIPEVHYKNIYIPWKSLIPRMIRYSLIKHNVRFNQFYFDDGAGAYYNSKIYETSYIEKLLAQLFYGKMSTYWEYPVYLYSPKLYYKIHPMYDKQEVLKLEGHWNDVYYRSIVNRVFEYKTDANIEEKIVILDTVQQELSESGSAGRLLPDIYREIVRCFGTNNVILKRHPRDTSEPLPDICYYKYNAYPFELICLNNDMQEKILIAYDSTSATTSKVLFDYEPYVILLYRLFESGTMNKTVDDYYTLCGKTYNMKNRFFIPENEEELYSILNSLKRSCF